MGQSLLGGGPVRRVATAGGGERQENKLSTIRLNLGKIAVVWVVLGLVTGSSLCPRRAKALAAGDLQQKVLSGMQKQHLQGGNCCSDLTVRRVGLAARLIVNGWREAGGCPRRISESKKGEELFRSGSSRCLAS